MQQKKTENGAPKKLLYQHSTAVFEFRCQAQWQSKVRISNNNICEIISARIWRYCEQPVEVQVSMTKKKFRFYLIWPSKYTYPCFSAV